MKESTPSKAGRTPLDPAQRKKRRNVCLTDKADERLSALAREAGKSTGDYVTARLKLDKP